jgi:hypothetical protein
VERGVDEELMLLLSSVMAEDECMSSMSVDEAIDERDGWSDQSEAKL